MNFFIVAICNIEISLLRIIRERDIPNRAVTQCSFGYKAFFYEFSVLLGNLNAVVLPVADVDLPVFRYRGATHGAELLRCGSIWIVSGKTGVVRLFTVSAPVALVGAGFGIKYHHAPISKA